MSIVSSGSEAVNRGPDPLLLCLSSTEDYLKIFKTLSETLLLRKNLDCFEFQITNRQYW